MTVIDGGALNEDRRRDCGDQDYQPVVTDPISADLKKVMRQLKLGRMLDTLPERLTLARQRHLSHAAFLELVLADEATRRDTSSAARRARELRPGPGHAPGHLGRFRGRALRPHPVDRADQSAVPRRASRGTAPGRVGTG